MKIWQRRIFANPQGDREMEFYKSGEGIKFILYGKGQLPIEIWIEKKDAKVFAETLIEELK